MLSVFLRVIDRYLFQEDGPEYEVKMFWARMGDFKFWLMTNAEPIPELLEMFYVIRVKPAPPKE